MNSCCGQNKKDVTNASDFELCTSVCKNVSSSATADRPCKKSTGMRRDELKDNQENLCKLFFLRPTIRQPVKQPHADSFLFWS